MLERKTALALLALAALTAACAPAADAPAAQAAQPQAAATPLIASGAPIARALEEASDTLEWAASVVRVDDIANQGALGVHLFGIAGGDPAMNGLHTYISFYENPAEGHRTFMIGDILDYRILSSAPGRVDLELRESVMNAAAEIGTRSRTVIVTWTVPPEGEAPAAISITPARAGE